MPSAVVFGGSGQLGVATTRALASAGWQVWAVTRDGRRPPPWSSDFAVRLADGTERSRAQVLREIGTVDGVFDPTSYNAADAADLMGARGMFGAAVVVSSASVYAAPDGTPLLASSRPVLDAAASPITEAAATVAAGDATYISQKVAMEQALLGSGLAVSVLRPCAVHGPYATHPREWWLLKRGLDRRPAIPVAFGARSVFHITSAAGIADVAVRCMELPGARVLNVADEDAVGQIAATLARLSGLPIPLAPFEGPPVGPSHIGSTPWSVEGRFVLDTAAAGGLGWRGGRYEQTVKAACDWVLDVARSGDWVAQFSRFSKYGYDPFDYAAEDAFLARA